MSKPLRQSMPTVAAWIDDLRAAFGDAQINAAIRAGMDGQPTFYASENGIEIGVRAPYDANKAVSMSDIVLDTKNATAAPRDGRKGRK